MSMNSYYRKNQFADYDFYGADYKLAHFQQISISEKHRIELVSTGDEFTCVNASQSQLRKRDAHPPSRRGSSRHRHNPCFGLNAHMLVALLRRLESSSFVEQF